MRYFVAMAAVVTVVQLAAGVASAQELASPDERVEMYEPEDYASLRARIEQLEANQRYSAPAVASLDPQGGVYVQYDNVIVKPYLSENSAFPAQIADGNVVNYGFNLDMEYSPRIEVGYMAPTSNLGFRARYWHFGANAATGPANDANGLIADDAIAIAAGATIQDVDTITSVVYDLNMDVLDLEATRAVGSSGTFAAGIRTAWMGQKYGLDSDEGQLFTDLDVAAIGPTLAYEWKSHDFWFDGLRGLATVRGSLLYGGKDVNSVGPDNTYTYNEQSLISNADLQLGLEYRRSGGFFLRAALEAQYWANTGNATNHNVGPGDDVGDSEFVGSILDDDLGFLGMVFSAGYSW